MPLSPYPSGNDEVMRQENKQNAPPMPIPEATKYTSNRSMRSALSAAVLERPLTGTGRHSLGWRYRSAFNRSVGSRSLLYSTHENDVRNE